MLIILSIKKYSFSYSIVFQNSCKGIKNFSKVPAAVTNIGCICGRGGIGKKWGIRKFVLKLIVSNAGLGLVTYF